MDLTRRTLSGLIAATALGLQRARIDEVVTLRPNLLTRLAVAVRIEAARPVLFVIDSGAERTCLSRALADRLGLASAGPIRVHSIASAMERPSARVGRLAVGGLRFTDLRAPVFEADALGADGLLGLDVLSRFRLVLDVANNRALLDGGGFRISGGVGSRVEPTGVRTRRGPSGQLILGRAAANGVPVFAFIDSGAEHSVGNLALLRATMPPGAPLPSATIPVFGVAGDAVLTRPGRLEALEVGRTRVGAVRLLFADLHCFETLGMADQPALLIGSDILTRFARVTIDFPAGRIVLEGLGRSTAQTGGATEAFGNDEPSNQGWSREIGLQGG